MYKKVNLETGQVHYAESEEDYNAGKHNTLTPPLVGRELKALKDWLIALDSTAKEIDDILVATATILAGK